MKRVFSIVVFILTLSFIGYSQEVKNIVLEVRENKLAITYDILHCPHDMLYDVDLYVFTKEGTDKIKPKTISGALKNVSEGSSKVIFWDPIADGVEINGEIKVLILLTNPHRFSVPNGPSNAILSAFIPGAGSARVYSNPLPLLLTAGYAFSLINLYTLDKKNTEAYANYQNAYTQEQMDEYFAQIQSNRNKQFVYAGIAGGIWVTDIILSYVKGKKNKEIERRKLSYSTPSKYDFHLSSTNSTIGFSLVKRF